MSGLLALVVLAVVGGISIPTARAGEAAPPLSGPVPAAPSLLTANHSVSPRAGQSPAASCSYNASTAKLLGTSRSADWLGWVEQLSGAAPVVIAGETYTITTRYTPALFSGAEYARAYDFVLEQVQGWGYPPASIEQDPWSRNGFSGTNLVLTIPGQITPTQVVALIAHLDSISPEAYRDTLAPGAEDNASGSAALLEAARLFRYYHFDRTVKIIWFTGEEQGMLGSGAYISDHNVDDYQGVVNLDMFGYDNDDDRCFELHVGVLPESDEVGQCIVEGIAAYSLDLSYDYLTSNFTGASDHSPFWQQGVGAVLLHQNGNLTTFGGCGGVRDRNPYYHTINDTVANSFPPYDAGQPNTVGADIARAGLAAVAGMAGNRGACFDEAPWATLQFFDGAAHLAWTSLPGAASYRLYRRVDDDPEALVYSGSETAWVDAAVVPGWDHHYRVYALAADGLCQSIAGQTVLFWIGRPQAYLPVVKR